MFGKVKNKLISLLPWLVLLTVVGFILYNLGDLSLVFSPESVTGGDLGTHYYTFLYLVEELLPNLKILGWNQGAFGGFPLFQYYHCMMFLVGALLNLILPVTMSFKLLVFVSLISMPIAAFFSLRILKCSTWSSALASLFIMLSLYHDSHQIYGGNFSSIFAGEFSYSIANSLFLVYLATLYRGVSEQKYLILNALLLAVLCLTHMVTFVVAVPVPLFFLFNKNFKKNLLYITKMNFYAFLLTSWWSIPMVLKLGYTAEMMDNFNRWTNIKNIFVLFPELLLPLHAVLILYLLFALIKPTSVNPKVLYFTFVMIIASSFYYHGWVYWMGRFHPFNGIMAAMCVAIIIGSHFSRQIYTHFFYLSVIIFYTVLTGSTYSKVNSFFSYSFSGLQNRPGFDDFTDINKFIDSNFKNERFFAEKSEKRQKNLTHRSFEYTPYYSKGLTLEGTYTEGSLGFMFSKIIASEINQKEILTPAAHSKLREYNIGWFIATKDKRRKQLNLHKDFTSKAVFGIYEMFSIDDNAGTYVEVLDGPTFRLKKELHPWKVEAKTYFKNNDFERYRFVYNDVNDKRFIDVNELKEIEKQKLNKIENCILHQKIENQSFEFKTRCLNKPHVIKISYFPDWKVTGADNVFLVSPGFMLIYPSQENVVLKYKRSSANILGNSIFITGLFIWLFLLLRSRRQESEFLSPEPLSRRGLALVATIYVYILVPDSFYHITNYYFDKQNYQQAEELYEKKNYQKALFLLDNIKSKKLKADKNYLSALIYFHTRQYNRVVAPVFSYVNIAGLDERTPQLRYYLTTAMLRQKKYKEYMHELYVITSSHPGNVWAKKAQKEFQEWRIENPKIYELNRRYQK